MKKFRAIDFVKFVYLHCLKPCLFSWMFVAFAACYWALDLQFRYWIFKEIIEKFESVERSSALTSMLPWIYIYFIVLVLRFLIFNLSNYLRIYCIPHMKINLLKFIMRELLVKSNVLVKKELDLLSNQIQEILKNCESLMKTIFINIVAHISLLIISLWIFYVNKYLLYAISFLYIAFFALSFIGYIKGVKLNANILSFDMVLFARFNDIFFNMFNVQLLETHEYEENKLNPYFDQFKQTSIHRDYWYLIINGMLSILFISYHCFCIFFLVWQYQSGAISKAYFPYIFAINRDVTEALWYVVDDLTSLSECVGKTMDSIKKVFSDTLLLEKRVERFNLDSYDIEFDNISFSYPGSQNCLFDGLSLHIKQGDKVGIVGYSGSGKSSLASLLLNLCPVQSGIVKIGGIDINLFSYPHLHSLITFMNQDLSLFNRSIKENIIYGKLDATEEEMIEAAKMANIHEFINTLPNQYDTVLEYQGKELSYGQKQRILIARAFLRDTPILILDEVTSSLDAKSEHMVMDSLCQLMKNKTVLIIAHKIKTLFGMDYIVGMSKGKIIEVGTHDELIEKKSVYFDLLNS